MGVPFKSLDAVTATGAGATHANLSVLTGGSSPTVTAWIASA